MASVNAPAGDFTFFRLRRIRIDRFIKPIENASRRNTHDRTAHQSSFDINRFAAFFLGSEREFAMIVGVGLWFSVTGIAALS